MAADHFLVRVVLSAMLMNEATIPNNTITRIKSMAKDPPVAKLACESDDVAV
jgi:hypothetical protein